MIRVFNEYNNLKDFKPESYDAKVTIDTLSDSQAKKLCLYLTDVFRNGLVSETDLDDYLVYERDDIASLLSFTSWDDLVEHNNSIQY